LTLNAASTLADLFLKKQVKAFSKHKLGVQARGSEEAQSNDKENSTLCFNVIRLATGTAIVDRGVLSLMTHEKMDHLPLAANKAVRVKARDAAVYPTSRVPPGRLKQGSTVLVWTFSVNRWKQRGKGNSSSCRPGNK